MSAKKSAPKSIAVNFSLVLTRRSGAPPRPGQDALARLLARAWRAVPGAHRPDTRGASRLTLDLMLVNDAEISEFNVTHLKHAGPTDVLSFPMGEYDPERRAYHLGEIVVSFETAAREAAARRLPYAEELGRYCVHGFLHLLGYDDVTLARRREMFEVQEKVIKTARV